MTKTRVTVYFEKHFREQAKFNSKMQYLNVQLLGLSGAAHPALLNIKTTQEVIKLRQHIKFLTGDYLTAERLALDQGSSPRCRLCPSPLESIQHVLTQCSATAETHRRIMPELLNVTMQVQPTCSILHFPTQHLTQFILDCTSINLPATHRIPAHNPRVSEVFRISRDWCYAVSKERARLLKQKK